MARRNRSPIESAPVAEPSSSRGLRLHSAGERLGTLRAQRERLLGEVRKKRAALEAAIAEGEAARQTTIARMAPIMARFEVLRSEVGALLAELLTPGRLSARARKEVKRVQRSLIAQDLIAEPDDGGSPDEEPRYDSPFGERDEAEFNASSFGHGASNGERVAPAPQHGQARGRESLRVLFRRLALAVHPDRAQGETERARRTEAMKEATRAYEDGDLARLLELEKAWQIGSSIPSNATEEGLRCAELEQTLRELRRQVRELSSELRAARQRMRNEMIYGSTDDVVASAESELKDFERIRDFVQRFRDGKITLREFIAGPGLPEDAAVMIDIDELLREFIEEQPRPAPKRPPRASAKRRR